MMRIALIAALATAALAFPSSNKIIGGSDAKAATYVWQVSLQVPSFSGDGYWHFCGGSLITSKYVVTAAHCEKSPSVMSVYLGSTNKFEGGYRHNVASFIIHPGYDSAKISNDFGIIKLVTPADTSNVNIGVVALPVIQSETVEYTGDATVTGWGYSSYNSVGQNELPGDLQVGILAVLSDYTCESKWGSHYLSDVMVCAGANGISSCMGDSGGPLVQDIDGVTTLIGVVSWGQIRCSTTFPSVFAKTASVKDWIVRNSNYPDTQIWEPQTDWNKVLFD